MQIEIDSDLKIKTADPHCLPIIFVPKVDLFGLEEECIIDAF
jgi:hypothetical protein